MKKSRLILYILVVISTAANAQDTKDSRSNTEEITYENIFWSPQFYHQGKPIKLKGVSSILREDTEAYKMLNSGKTLMVFGYLMAGTGGFILGYNMYNENAQARKQNLLIGAGIAAGGIFLDFLASKQIKSSIDLYNSHEKNLQGKDISLIVGLNDFGNGVGITLNF